MPDPQVRPPWEEPIRYTDDTVTGEGEVNPEPLAPEADEPAQEPAPEPVQKPGRLDRNDARPDPTRIDAVAEAEFRAGSPQADPTVIRGQGEPELAFEDDDDLGFES